MDALTATLALLRIEGLGPARYWQLHEQFGDAQTALYALPETYLQRLPPLAQQQWRDFYRDENNCELVQWAQAEQQRCSQAGVRLLHGGDTGYPNLLRQISRPPPILYVRGNHHLLDYPQIAIVGARSASNSGLDNARAFAVDLAAAGFAITSGLALGVDAAAHRGALQAGGGTVAVLGTGVDQIYPRRNVGLAEEILTGNGVIISELPMGSPAEGRNFPRRNRIISGLSIGVLLVEAALRSGSLITARLALEQNREVFAIPGSIHSPLARGCHRMIKDGAALVEASADIVEQLGGLLADSPAQLASGDTASANHTALFEQQLLDEPLQQLVGALGCDPRNIEQLAQDTGAAAGPLLSQLLQLELLGLVEQVHAGYQLTPAGAGQLEKLSLSG